jgi:signal transduction histidine kinase/ligand-binding sensor domain-containing protein/CheY-like chemotaxis protein/AraC-like DNA-binding protein
MKKPAFLFLYLLLASLTSANGIQNSYFEHLKVNNGLSHYSVNALYQDEHGMIWIGTRDGLNRYDGNEITVYKQISGDSTALFGNNIRSVYGDKKGHLFLQCKSGLVTFDLKTEIFRTIRRQDVSTISYGKENLWFASSDTIFSYKPDENNPSKSHLLLSDKTLRTTSIIETSDRLLYIATSTKGILVYDRNLKIVRRLNINDVVYMYEDSKKNVWACTRYSGLYKIDFSGGMVNYQHNPADPESIPDNFVRTICEDDFGNYWIGLFTGLCKLDTEKEKEKFSLYKYERHISHGISNSSVWTIINDDQGTIWVGTYFGGIDLFNPRYSIYNFYGAHNNSPFTLSNPVVGRIISEQSGNLWIGTDGGGLNYFERKNNRFYAYQTVEGKNSISSNTIKSLWLDEKRGNLWIGTHLGGLNKLHLQSRRFTVFLHDPKNPVSIPNNNVREIVHRNDTIFLATQNSIGIFDLRTEKCTTLKFDGLDYAKREIPDIFLDSKNRLWFSVSNMSYCWRPDTKQLQKFEMENNVLLFYEDTQGRIWAGTDGNGLYLFNEESVKLEPCQDFNKHLPSKYIIDIRESGGGYFYVSTNAGLLIVDIELQNSQVLNSVSGFPLVALNENSLLITDKNEIFAGGINGMVSFHEKDLNIPRASYSVNITGIRVNNKKVSPGSNSIIKQSLPYLGEITLKPQHSVISILFATTNYINVLKTDIEYQLVGFDKDWIDANYQQSVTYTNLNAGTYTLRLRGKKKTDAGIFPEKAITITVLPPFYKTTVAYIFYAILILSIAITILRFYTSKIQLSTSLEYEKREKKHIEDLNQSKLRFFTNISHEFRTPLTLIINQIEIILQMGHIPQSIYGKLLNVMRNANRMKKLITELIDFRKYEQGFMQLKVSEYDLIPFLNEIYLSFKELAQSKNINYTFEYKQPDIKLWFDNNQMEKVFYNLLVNAFKYTVVNGNITMRVEDLDNYILISVVDDGVGIDKKSLEQIFDRFYQAENSSLDLTTRQGSGIGLALAKGIVNLHHGDIGVISEPNNGSRFWVKLPVGDTHFTRDQIITAQDKDQLCISELQIPDRKFIEEIITSQKEADAHNSTILIIEDSEEILSLLANIFEPIYKVITAIDGQDGFEKAIKHHPDIILSDVMMPRMSGVEMCSKLKSNFETSHIPIVLLTAQTAADYVVHGLLTGADDYIIKPFNQKVLVTRCNNLVNSRKLLQKKYAMQPDLDPQIIATNAIDQQILEKASGIVEKNIDNPDFDVNKFASEMCLSRTNLFYKLKGVTGQTPNDFIMNIKLKKSIYYLVNSPDMDITDIAFQAGFGSSSYYIKKFHKLYGLTPAQYRKQNLVKNNS